MRAILTAIACVVCVPRVKAESAATTEVRGSVLDVLRELLARGHDAAVLELVAKLVSRNEELEQLLAKVRAGKHHNERIPKEQLDLFLDLLRAASATTLATANEQLEKTAQDNGGRPDPRTQTPAKQPPVRRPPLLGCRASRIRSRCPPPSGRVPSAAESGCASSMSDTHPAAEAILLEGLRRMSPAEKLARVAALNEATATLVRARLRRDYPGMTQRQEQLRLASLRLGRSLVVRVFGWDPDVEGW
jgi:hypothetical protein